MLNYVWISLVAIGILVAVGKDVADETQNTYRNGIPLTTSFEVQQKFSPTQPTVRGMLNIPAAAFNQFYGRSAETADIHQPVTLFNLPSGERKIELTIGEHSPAFWREMAKSASSKDKLEGKVISLNFSPDGNPSEISFTVEKISYVKIKAVTRAALDYADTAVTISLGLIGVMALWLGIMKVGEEAGLLKVLTRILTPVTRRLFPDVPPDHPAVGAMIMNIAANMLGLNNAATPLGLKAMEELNKLNPKLGTATNAMCTFLVINTAGLTLIPATAIAIRAAQGSSDPGIIIGTSIFGAGCATVTGLIAVKILQRLPQYKKQLEEETNG